MALKNPYSARDVQPAGEYSLQVTLPKNVLEREDVEKGDDVPVKRRKDSLVLQLEHAGDDVVGPSVRIVPVGNSLGFTIPSGLRREYGLETGDTVFLGTTERNVAVRLE